MQQWAADHDTYMKITKQWIYFTHSAYKRKYMFANIQYVDSQIWHLLRSTGQTGRACTVRVELDFL